jgi:hypothetical protein
LGTGFDDGFLPGARSTVVESNIVFAICSVNADIGNIILDAHGRLIPLILIERRELAACTREKIMEKVEALFPENSLRG